MAFQVIPARDCGVVAIYNQFTLGRQRGKIRAFLNNHRSTHWNMTFKAWRLLLRTRCQTSAREMAEQPLCPFICRWVLFENKMKIKKDPTDLFVLLDPQNPLISSTAQYIKLVNRRILRLQSCEWVGRGNCPSPKPNASRFDKRTLWIRWSKTQNKR